MRWLILATVLALGGAPADADQIRPYARLQCSGGEAIVRFEFGKGVTPLPGAEAKRWQNVPFAGPKGCELANGQAVVVLQGELDWSESAGGGDPPGFISLWVGGKKLISREFYKGGHGAFGLTYNSVHYAPGSLTRCTYPEATEHYGDIGKVTCKRTPMDIAALLSDPQEPTPAMLAGFGTFSTLSVSSEAFCRSLVKQASDITEQLRPSVLYMSRGEPPKQFLAAPPGTLFPMSKSGRNADNPFNTTDWDVRDRAGSLKYQVRHFDLTNSGGEQTILRLWEDSIAFFGDIYLYRKGIASQADIDAVIEANASGEPQIEIRRLAAEAGWRVAYAPDERFSRIYEMPLRIEGATYLFVYGFKVEATPTATLYRMKPDDTLDTVCVFQEMRPPF